MKSSQISFMNGPILIPNVMTFDFPGILFYAYTYFLTLLITRCECSDDERMTK